MKQETLKKIVNLAYGFKNWNTLDLPCVRYHAPGVKISIAVMYISKWEHYPLLLYRAVQGINDGLFARITQYPLKLKIELLDGSKSDHLILFIDQQPTKILTPEEVAIEKALVYLLEIK